MVEDLLHFAPVEKNSPYFSLHAPKISTSHCFCKVFFFSFQKSKSQCSNYCGALDLNTNTWIDLECQKPAPKPRAGNKNNYSNNAFRVKILAYYRSYCEGYWHKLCKSILKPNDTPFYVRIM